MIKMIELGFLYAIYGVTGIALLYLAIAGVIEVVIVAGGYNKAEQAVNWAVNHPYALGAIGFVTGVFAMVAFN